MISSKVNFHNGTETFQSTAVGIARIYWRKAKYLFDDCNEALFRIKVTINTQTTTRHVSHEEAHQGNTTTMTIPVTGKDLNMLLPEPEVDLEAILENSQKAANMSRMDSFNRTDITVEISLENKRNEQEHLLGFDDDEAAQLLKEFTLNFLVNKLSHRKVSFVNILLNQFFLQLKDNLWG